MGKTRISELTTKRLSLYLRCLDELEALGVEQISSGEMADRFQLNSSQFRKDLACFGEFGVRGVGYDVGRLRREIADILGLDTVSPVVIVGAGNLGHALADYPGFNSGGFRIVALFDSDPDKISTTTRRGKPIHGMHDLEEIVGSEEVELGIVAVPAEAAQGVVDRLVDAGVRAILNFAPVRPSVPDTIRCNSVDLKVELESLSFFLSSSGDAAAEETGSTVETG